MAAVEITPADLEAHPDITGSVDLVKALALISTVVARAARFAPCILQSGFDATDAAKGVLLDVVARRYQAITPGVTVTKGPWTESTDSQDRPAATFWPEEIKELQALCRTAGADRGVPVSAFPACEPWPDPIIPRVWVEA